MAGEYTWISHGHPDHLHHQSIDLVRPGIRLLEAFISVDIDIGAITRNHAEQTSDETQITDRCGDDDWTAGLDEAEWARVEAFFRRFEMMWEYMDFVAVTVAGEMRRFDRPGGAGRNPAGTFGYLWVAEWNHVILPWMRDTSEKLGVKPVLKWIYGRLVGSPVRS